jgi:membrane protease YdiL (CAAX protease family)
MPDPTEFAITAAFMASLGVFAIAVILRKLRGRQNAEIRVPEIPVDGEICCPPPLPFPPSGSLPPELPFGRVKTWIYQPFDLLGLGLIFGLFALLVIPSLQAPDEAMRMPGKEALLVSIAFQFILAGIACAWVIRRIGLVEWLGLRWPEWRWVFLIAPGAVLSMWFFFGILQMSGFMDWIESMGVESMQDTVKLLQESQDPVVLGLMAVAATLAAPICEEIVFRGYFYAAAKKFSGPWVATFCSSLVFAAAHGSLGALLPLFVFGCLLVFLYEKTGSLWASVAVHFLFNSATVLFQFAARYYQIPLDPP